MHYLPPFSISLINSLLGENRVIVSKKEHTTRDAQNIEINYLPICYNLQDLASKQLLYIHPSLWWLTDELIFKECGYVFHFNAIPKTEMGRDANYWIKRTYEELYK